MKIEVTQEDIDKGKRASCSACPIALAANRSLGTVCEVYLNKVHVLSGSKFYDLPPEASEFVLNFDKSKPKLHPFSFELEGI